MWWRPPRQEVAVFQKVRPFTPTILSDVAEILLSTVGSTGLSQPESAGPVPAAPVVASRSNWLIP